ncbi:MAG: GspH/FimT family pseudopilin [Ahniella sp.]|nr:GspH/FimT family pseudopilin [Ahniella sp.]
MSVTSSATDRSKSGPGTRPARCRRRMRGYGRIRHQQRALDGSLPILGRHMRMIWSQNRAVKGFTLIELLTGLGIAAILVGLALPSFREYSQNANATAQGNQLVADLTLARVEAVKLGSAVRLSAVGGNFTGGWVVASDRDRNGSLNGTDRILREAPAARTDFEWIAGTNSGTPISNVFFDSNGYLALVNEPLMFQLITPDRDTRKCKRVVVGLSGRAESRKGINNPCTP